MSLVHIVTVTTIDPGSCFAQTAPEHMEAGWKAAQSIEKAMDSSVYNFESVRTVTVVLGAEPNVIVNH